MILLMENDDFEYRKKIGKKVKLARIKIGYTQDELAEKLSLSTRYISQIERGISFGTASTIINICKTLNISADYLFEDIIKPNESSNIFDISFSKNYVRLKKKNIDFFHLLAADLLKMQ